MLVALAVFALLAAALALVLALVLFVVVGHVVLRVEALEADIARIDQNTRKIVGSSRLSSLTFKGDA